jgi:hypothetical protein
VKVEIRGGFHKREKFSGLFKPILASQEGLCHVLVLHENKAAL